MPPPNAFTAAVPQSIPAFEPPIGIPPSVQGAARLSRPVGAGFLVALGYIDPGNWATDVAGGSQFGFSLLCVVIGANLLALIFQYLAVKLGIGTGLNLAQACARQYRPAVRLVLWLISEMGMIACGLAEILGASIAIQLLFSVPLAAAILISGLNMLLLLKLREAVRRFFEVLVICSLFTVAGLVGIEVLMAQPSLAVIAQGLATNPLQNREMAFLAAGILGATVMPHNIFLHSDLVRGPNFAGPCKLSAIKWATKEMVFALSLATLINGAILIFAAATFHAHGHSTVTELPQAYRMVSVTGAGVAAIIFAAGLWLSSQTAAVASAMAGQVVLQGFVGTRLNPVTVRLCSRALAILPALYVASLYGETGIAKLLLLTQVVLSVQLPFVAIPLLALTADKKRMGSLANGVIVRWAGAAAALVVIAIDGFLVATYIA